MISGIKTKKTKNYCKIKTLKTDHHVNTVNIATENTLLAI